MKPIPVYELSREDVVVHRALDRVAHDESPAVRPAAVPTITLPKVAPLPATVPDHRATAVPAAHRPHETRAETRVADPTPQPTKAGATPATPAAPPAVRNAVPTAATPQSTRTDARVADHRPAPASTNREVKDPTPVATRATSAPAVPAASATPPALGRTQVTDPTPPSVTNAPFFDLSKVQHLDGPVTFRSPAWH